MPIPVAERNYDRLIVAYDGALLYLSRKQPGSSQEPPAPLLNRGADADLYRYSFEDRSEKQLRSSLVDVTASADRKKLLLVLGENQLDIADAAEKLDSKPVELNGLRMLVDPHQEWHRSSTRSGGWSRPISTIPTCMASTGGRCARVTSHC